MPHFTAKHPCFALFPAGLCRVRPAGRKNSRDLVPRMVDRVKAGSGDGTSGGALVGKNIWDRFQKMKKRSWLKSMG